MTGTEFETAIKELGLSQLAAGRLFEKDGRTIRRWIKDGMNEPMIVVILALLSRGAVSVQHITDIKLEEGIGSPQPEPRKWTRTGAAA